MELSSIEQELLTTTDIPPGRLAELLVQLSALYADNSNKLEEILLAKPMVWNAMRKDFKSDTACERYWESTESGLQELKLKMTLKKIEKMMSACKTMISVRSDEARNLY